MQFDWINFYSECATKLLSFKNDRKALIEKIKAVYSSIDMKIPKLDSGDEIIDIDPFTVFGLFNKGITNSNRLSIITGIANEFEIEAKIPDNFDGIPVLNNLKATFYGFDKRKENDIENLWELFSSAMKLSDADTEENRAAFSKWYDIVHEQLCIRWNLTMALYWIRPYYFINLDSRNRWYITNIENMPLEFVESVKPKLNKLPNAADYLFIMDACRSAMENGDYEYKNFPELSYYAWKISEQVNQEKAMSAEKKASKAAFLRWFNPLIQALRDLCEDTAFADECFALGFQMDCGESFIAAYPDLNVFSDYRELDKIIDSVEDIQLLGSAIFSKWRYFNHWAGNREEITLTENRGWFITALGRLELLTSESGVSGFVFKGILKKAKLISNSLCYGPCPMPDDEIEQWLTLTDDGRL